MIIIESKRKKPEIVIIETMLQKISELFVSL